MINSKELITTKIINLWKEYKISTLNYLMWINILGCRSYRDLTQYPVFPWIISNYLQDKIILGKEVNIYKNEEFIINKLIDKYLRPLKFPMGMMEINNKSIRRKECYIVTYTNLMKEYFKNKGYKEYKEKLIEIERIICKSLIIDDNDKDKDIIELLNKEPEDMELREEEEKKKKEEEDKKKNENKKTIDNKNQGNNKKMNEDVNEENKNGVNINDKKISDIKNDNKTNEEKKEEEKKEKEKEEEKKEKLTYKIFFNNPDLKGFYIAFLSILFLPTTFFFISRYIFKSLGFSKAKQDAFGMICSVIIIWFILISFIIIYYQI